jgi:hypothetical protein
MKYLVWVRGISGPCAQLWAEKPRETSNKQEHWKMTMIGQPIELPEKHSALSIDEIRKLYPAPAVDDQ